MSHVLNTVNGVDVTQEMVDLFAKRNNVDVKENHGSNLPGVVATIGGWVEGRGELDSALTESEEGRVVFAPVRTAYFKALGHEEPAPANGTFEPKPQADQDLRNPGVSAE